MPLTITSITQIVHLVEVWLLAYVPLPIYNLKFSRPHTRVSAVIVTLQTNRSTSRDVPTHSNLGRTPS